jgi:hypothetical protein
VYKHYKINYHQVVIVLDVQNFCIKTRDDMTFLGG